jgi:hypothetical protein
VDLVQAFLEENTQWDGKRSARKTFYRQNSASNDRKTFYRMTFADKEEIRFNKGMCDMQSTKRETVFWASSL